MKGGVRWFSPYLVVGRPSGVTVAIQCSAGDRTIVEHIDHLKEYVEDSDDPLTSWLTNDLPVHTEVNSQHSGCGTQIPELPTDQSQVEARDECTVGDDSTVVDHQGMATDDAISLQRGLRTRRTSILLDM